MSPGTKTSGTFFFFFVFFVPPQVLARFSPVDFGFFGTSSGFGNIFFENLEKLGVFLYFQENAAKTLEGNANFQARTYQSTTGFRLSLNAP